METPSSSKPANVPIEKFENDPSVDPLSDVQSELRVSAEEPRKKSGSDRTFSMHIYMLYFKPQFNNGCRFRMGRRV